jgi:hypothetical protein
MTREFAQLSFSGKETGVKLGNEQWCKNVPKSVAPSYGIEVTILRNNKVNSDKTIPNKKNGHHNP